MFSVLYQLLNFICHTKTEDGTLLSKILILIISTATMPIICQVINVGFSDTISNNMLIYYLLLSCSSGFRGQKKKKNQMCLTVPRVGGLGRIGHLMWKHKNLRINAPLFGGRFFIDWVVEYCMKQIWYKFDLILGVKTQSNCSTNVEL